MLSLQSRRLFSYPPKANNLKSNHLIRVRVQSSVSRGQRGRTQTALTRVLCKRRPTWGKLGVKAVRCSNIYRIRPQTEWDKMETFKTKRPQNLWGNAWVQTLRWGVFSKRSSSRSSSSSGPFWSSSASWHFEPETSDVHNIWATSRWKWMTFNT